jgi:hypothetical protein
VLEQAFRAGDVDEMVAGDWEDVQVALGLKAKREKPRQPPAPGTAAASIFELAEAIKKPRPPITPSPQSVVEARLAKALREAELEMNLGAKRKHHRKRK